MKALFFADGGRGAGLGHLRRCLSTAQGFLESGWDCRFLAPDRQARSWLEVRGAAFAEAKLLAGTCFPQADFSCDLFVLDSYRASSAEVRAALGGAARLVLAFDDHFNRHDVAGMIVNTGFLAARAAWPARDSLPHLLGPRYHPLAVEFRGLPLRAPKPCVEKALVTLGGDSPEDSLARVLDAVRRALPSAAIDCVLGPFGPEAAKASRPGVSFHRDPRDLRELMSSCDLAVSAAGQTLFELAATGTPAAAFALADNQLPNLEGMAQAGVVLGAGRLSDPSFGSKLEAALGRLSPAAVREEMSRAGPRLVDGEGARRIAAAVEALLASGKAAR